MLRILSMCQGHIVEYEIYQIIKNIENCWNSNILKVINDNKFLSLFSTY